jgi:hypothetical protein
LARPRLALVARIAGIVLLLGGTAHTFGLLWFYATHGTPEGHRVALHLFVAYAQWVAGALDVIASVGLRRGEPWARAPLSVGALLAVAFGATAFPLLSGGPRLLQVAPAIYLVVHLGLGLAVWVGPRGPTRPAGA